MALWRHDSCIFVIVLYLVFFFLYKRLNFTFKYILPTNIVCVSSLNSYKIDTNNGDEEYQRKKNSQSSLENTHLQYFNIKLDFWWAHFFVPLFLLFYMTNSTGFVFYCNFTAYFCNKFTYRLYIFISLYLTYPS